MTDRSKQSHTTSTDKHKGKHSLNTATNKKTSVSPRRKKSTGNVTSTQCFSLRPRSAPAYTGIFDVKDCGILIKENSRCLTAGRIRRAPLGSTLKELDFWDEDDDQISFSAMKSIDQSLKFGVCSTCHDSRCDKRFCRYISMSRPKSKLKYPLENCRGSRTSRSDTLSDDYTLTSARGLMNRQENTANFSPVSQIDTNKKVLPKISKFPNNNNKKKIKSLKNLEPYSYKEIEYNSTAGILDTISLPEITISQCVSLTNDVTASCVSLPDKNDKLDFMTNSEIDVNEYMRNYLHPSKNNTNRSECVVYDSARPSKISSKIDESNIEEKPASVKKSEPVNTPRFRYSSTKNELKMQSHLNLNIRNSMASNETNSETKLELKSDLANECDNTNIVIKVDLTSIGVNGSVSNGTCDTLLLESSNSDCLNTDVKLNDQDENHDSSIDNDFSPRSEVSEASTNNCKIRDIRIKLDVSPDDNNDDKCRRRVVKSIEEDSHDWQGGTTGNEFDDVNCENDEQNLRVPFWKFGSQ